MPLPKDFLAESLGRIKPSPTIAITTKARELKERHATLDLHARQSDPDAERVSRATAGAAGQLLSLLQSSVVFAKSQIRLPGLKLDKVLLCGGGARMDGITRWLSSAMSVRVELFDPVGLGLFVALVSEEHAHRGHEPDRGPPVL